MTAEITAGKSPEESKRPDYAIIAGYDMERAAVLAMLSLEAVSMREVCKRLHRRLRWVSHLSYRLGELACLGYALRTGKRGKYLYALTAEGEECLNHGYLLPT